LTFEEIEKMKKGEFINKVKRKIECKTLKDLEKIKENPSTVRQIKHPILKLQKYLMPNKVKMNKEECQLIKLVIAKQFSKNMKIIERLKGYK
jgi:hypothetical protein